MSLGRDTKTRGGKLLRAYDWASTTLGPFEKWPPRLIGQVDLVLDAAQPMYIAVGPDLHFIYNDAYEPVIGNKGPRAFGRPMREVFADIWPQLDKLFADTLAGRPQIVQDMHIDTPWRPAKPEGWFSFSLVPIRDDKGSIGGFVASLFETTNEVQLRKVAAQSEERQAFLLRFSDALREEDDVDGVANRAITMLSDEMKLDRCYITLYRAEEDEAVIPYQTGNNTVPPLPPKVRLSDFPDAYEQVRHKSFVVEDDFVRSGLTETERANSSALGMRAMLASTVRQGGGNPLASLMAVSSSPRRWTPSEIALVEEATERTWSAMERGRAEAALRESEERLRQFGEASQDVLWIRNAQTMQWQYLTPAFEDIYGLTRKEALTGDNFRSWLDLIVPEDREHAQWALDRVLKGEHVIFEYRVQRPVDGAIRWLRNTDFPMRGPGGEIERIGGIGQDITDSKRIQEELEQNEERLRSAVEVGKLGLWDWNVATGELHWSDEHFRMEGYAVGEITPSYEAWLSRLHPDDRAPTEAQLQQAMKMGSEFAQEFRVVHPDSSVRWLYGRGRFFYGQDGKPLRMIGAMIDTTDRREWEERQHALVAELQHRTRNLMGIVRSIADKTARASVDLPEFRERFHDRLMALSRVQGLLSRLNEHDRVTFEEVVEAELAAMGGVADRVSLKGPKGVRLRSSTVQTLAMAIHELATNAVKYGALSQPGARLSIDWSLASIEGEAGRPWLQVEWRESGVSMPPANSGPAGTGQGRELIERVLPYQLSAKTSYELGPNGVHCTIVIPVSATGLKELNHD